jgi:hypothetical protein
MHAMCMDHARPCIFAFTGCIRSAMPLMTVCFCCYFLCFAAGVLDCTVEASNTGNVQIKSSSLGGDVVNCSTAGQSIAPGRSVVCSLRKTITAAELEAAGSLSLSFLLTVTPSGLVPTLESVPLQVYSANLSKIISASPACATCRGCLTYANDFVKQFGAQPGVASLAKSFGTFCEQSDVLRQTQACSRVQAAIANSTMGNLGRRAAGLCLSLQLCDRKLGASCAAKVNVSTSPTEVSASTLDVCTGKHPKYP